MILSAESRLLDLDTQFAACPGCGVTDVPTNAAATPTDQIAQAARLVWACRKALWSFILYGLFCLVAHRLGVCVRRLCWQFSRVAAGLNPCNESQLNSDGGANRNAGNLRRMRVTMP